MEAHSKGVVLNGVYRRFTGLRSALVVLAGVAGFGASTVHAVCPIGPCTSNAQCNDGKFCTADLCIGNNCICVHNNDQCEDGNFCDGDNFCNAATDTCDEGPPPTCNAPLFCSIQYADCVECDDTHACPTQAEPSCNSSGVCVECTDPVQCQDTSFCNGQESCDGSGVCQNGTPISCTKNCFRGTSPGAVCTSNGTCGSGGICVGFCSELRLQCVQCHEDVDCDNGVFCDGVETCVNNVCVAGPATSCKRCIGGSAIGTPCSMNSECPGSTCTGATTFCNESSNQCVLCMNDSQCDDFNYCTSNACVFNSCVFSPKNSICEQPDGLFCNGVEVCNHQLGNPCSINRNDASCCFHGLCDPPKSCTTNAQCVTSQGQTCISNLCQPPIGCDTNAQCQSGQTCVNDTIPVVNDGISCTTDACVEATDQVTHTPNNAACSDGLACTGSETCVPGSVNADPVTGCVDGTDVDCSSLDTFCSIGQCNNGQGGQCQSVPRPERAGVTCQDNDNCTILSACTNGTCQEVPPAPGDPLRCVKLELRPPSPPPVPIGTTVQLSVYAVAQGCNNNPGDTDPCQGTSVRMLAMDALLSWNNVRLQLKPGTVGDPNPVYPCKYCFGGSTPGIGCTSNSQCLGGGTCTAQLCAGGSNPGTPCTSNAQCLGGGNCTGSDACRSCADSYPWITSFSGWIDDCGASQDGLNSPCVGTPTNDGDAKYHVSVPPQCLDTSAAPPACVTPAGLYVGDVKFVTTAGGPAVVSLEECLGEFSTAGVETTLLSAPTTNILNVLGNPVTINVQCDSHADCNDQNPCTSETCTCTTNGCPGTCIYTNNSSSTTCDDGLFCTTNDRCNGAGVCISTTQTCVLPMQCNEDLNQCYLVECQSNFECADATMCTVDVCVNFICQHNPVNCNDGVACTVDSCDPETGVCSYTANDAACATGLFCDANRCDLQFDCVKDHECMFNGDPGNPCPNASTCDEVNDNCGGCLAPSVQAAGSRYLRITPASQGATPVAFKVIGDCNDSESACVSSYVQSKCDRGFNDGLNCISDADCPKRCYSPEGSPTSACTTSADCPPGTGSTCEGKCETGTLGTTAFYKTSAQWGTIKVRGAQIRPNKNYLIETLCNFPPVVYSAAGEMRTWKWGETTGNSNVDALDIVRVIDAFRGIFSGGTTFEQVNHWGCTPDKTIDALDIALEIDAYRGKPYPCSMVCP